MLKFSITQEQMDLVTQVTDNHEAEFRKWADENESELMKWYDFNEDTGLFDTALRFSYYCTTKFLEWKTNNNWGINTPSLFS